MKSKEKYFLFDEERMYYKKEINAPTKRVEEVEDLVRQKDAIICDMEDTESMLTDYIQTAILFSPSITIKLKGEV